MDNVLFTIISCRDDHPEICRERASILLQSLLHRSLRVHLQREQEDCSPATDAPETETETETEVIKYALEFFELFCPIFQDRFTSRSQNSSNANTSGAKTRYKPTEEAEEIRLLLVQIMAIVVKFMATSKETHPHKIGDLLRSKQIKSSVGLLCQSISKDALRDTYPDLTRESCDLLKVVCRLFPNEIKMHAESLLAPLVGCSLPRPTEPTEMETEGVHSLDTLEDQIASIDLSASKNSLVRHRHAKTRSLAVETVGMIIACYYIHAARDRQPGIHYDMMDRLAFQVLPNLEGTGPFDKSSTVRIALARTVCSLAATAIGSCGELFALNSGGEPHLFDKIPKESASVISRLMVLYLMCASDESESVSSKAMEYGRTIGQASMGSCLTLVSQFACGIIDVLLRNLSSVRSVEHKKRHLDALNLAIRLINQDDSNKKWIQAHSNLIVKVLCDSFSSGEKVTFRATMMCVNALGASAPFRKTACNLTLEAIVGHNSAVSSDIGTTERKPLLLISSLSQCSSIFNFLSGQLRGALLGGADDDDTLWDDLHALTKALVSGSFIEYIHDPNGMAAYALLDLLNAIIEVLSNERMSSKSRNDEITPSILFCCVHLLGCQSDPDMIPIVQELVNSLPTNGDGHSSTVNSNLNALDLNFKAVFDLLAPDSDVGGMTRWAYGDPTLFAFEALIRNSHGIAVGTHIHIVGNILEAHLRDGSTLDDSDQSNEPCFRTKLLFMALLESIISDEKLPKYQLETFVEQLVCNVIVPNLAWKSGSAASSLRKLSMATMFTVARRGVLTNVILCKCVPTVLPLLKSNLSDDDASIRELATSTLGNMLSIMPRVLGEKAVNQIYHDLMKLLDDSSESVRMSACNTLNHFLGCAPVEHYQGAVIQCMVENLFIHMDDPNIVLQQKVYDVLITAMSVNKQLVLDNAKLCLSSHRSPVLCEMILRHDM